jgi:hypothetical protein
MSVLLKALGVVVMVAGFLAGIILGAQAGQDTAAAAELRTVWAVAGFVNGFILGVILIALGELLGRTARLVPVRRGR